MEPKSLLDTDWYIFTMAQFFFHRHPNAIGLDEFKCRNPKDTLFAEDKPSFVTMPELYDQLEEAIEEFCSLRFSAEELEWLSLFPEMKPDFLDFLDKFQLSQDEILFKRDPDNTFKLYIRGPMPRQIWYEVPLLSRISRIYGSVAIDRETASKNGWAKLSKIAAYAKMFSGYNRITIAEFGTRRRHNYQWQREAYDFFKNFKVPAIHLLGTSNVLISKEDGRDPIGTMAHKAVTSYQALGQNRLTSQRDFLLAWADEYKGAFGIALSDTLGFDKFLKDFDGYLSRLYDGVRHDSGDPLSWLKKTIEHYGSLGINPKTKKYIFSDGLTFKNAFKINTQLENEEWNCSSPIFAIGTEFSNYIGYKPAQNVIKLISCDDKPVAKLADDTGKSMTGNANYERFLREEIRKELEEL